MNSLNDENLVEKLRESYYEDASGAFEPHFECENCQSQAVYSYDGGFLCEEHLKYAFRSISKDVISEFEDDIIDLLLDEWFDDVKERFGVKEITHE